jgi:hypothetical protein
MCFARAKDPEHDLRRNVSFLLLVALCCKLKLLTGNGGMDDEQPPVPEDEQTQHLETLWRELFGQPLPIVGANDVIIEILRGHGVRI